MIAAAAKYLRASALDRNVPVALVGTGQDYEQD
jgi:hypothetical protein